MQQKRHYSRTAILCMAVIGVTAGVFVVLMAKDISVPAQVIEQELDAAAFAK